MILIITNRRRLVGYICALGIILLFGGGVYSAKFTSVTTISENNPAYLAIIIDDFGNNTDGTKEMMALNFPYTAAIMPSMPYTKDEEEMLHALGKDIILHMPMEPLNGKKSWLGPNALTTDLPDEQIKSNLANSLSEFKYCIGINNHMGSKATENERMLKNIFEFADEHDILFIDSKTSSKPIARELAKEYNITFLERDIFLDGTNNSASIEKNVLKSGEIAIKNGYCIAIGHVGASGGKPTVQALKNAYPKLSSQGVKFVTISELNEILKSQ